MIWDTPQRKGGECPPRRPHSALVLLYFLFRAYFFTTLFFQNWKCSLILFSHCKHTSGSLPPLRATLWNVCLCVGVVVCARREQPGHWGLGCNVLLVRAAATCVATVWVGCVQSAPAPLWASRLRKGCWSAKQCSALTSPVCIFIIGTWYQKFLGNPSYPQAFS